MKEVVFSNGRISAVQQGEGCSSPVLFVHGFLDNACSFAPLMPYLENYHCIAIDLPGHGKSAHRSADAHYHLTDYVYDVYSLIVENQWENVTLVGHSLGGIISTILAGCFPDLIRQLIVIESFGPLTEPEFTTVQQLRQSMLSRQLANKPIKQPESMSSIVSSRLRVSDMTAENAEIILRRNTECLEGKLTWSTDKRLRTKSSIRLTPNQALDIMENVQCPYYLVLGTSGFGKVKRLFNHRKSVVQKFSCVTIEGGHHVHMESPAEVASYIKDCFTSN